jgi:small conductance mechanosensitive channel
MRDRLAGVRSLIRLVLPGLALALWTGALTGEPAGAGTLESAWTPQVQEQEPPPATDADTVPAADTLSLPVPEELAQALEASAGLGLIRDSIEWYLVGQDTLSAAVRQARRSRVLALIEQAERLQTTLAELVPGLDSLPPEDAEIIDSAGVSMSGPGLVRSRVEGFLTWLWMAYREGVQAQRARADSLNRAFSEASREEAPALESQIRLALSQIDTLYQMEVGQLRIADRIGVSTDQAWRALEQEWISRADGLTGNLQLAQLERDRLREELRDAQRARLSDAQTSTIRTEIQGADRRIADLARALESTSDLLDQRGFETAQYRRLVIQATGEVTGDILNWNVLRGLVSDFVRSSVAWVRDHGPTMIVRFLIVMAFVVLGRVGIRVFWWAFRFLGMVHLPRLATTLVGRMLTPVGTVVGFGLGLMAIGVDPTTVLAGAGVLGVVVGFALQDSLSNLAAGFFILFYRPWDLDDVIEASGVVGRVRSMGLANTTLVTFDNRRVSVPNAKLWGSVVANRSSEPTRRAESVARVGYQEDLNKVMETVLGVLQDHDLVLEEPAASAHVSGSGPSWLELKVWAWTRNEDWWTLTASMPALIKTALHEAGIEIPLPRQEIMGLVDAEPAPGTD